MPFYRRRLPHWHPDDVPIFITWRLWGSLPLSASPKAFSTPGRAFLATDRLLDRDPHSPRWLSDPRIASLTAAAIQAGDHESHLYHLHAWTIMPNHVHLLIQPKRPLPVITHWLKGSTARRANLLLDRKGQPFWQDESFDHWIRNDREFERIHHYVEENPVSAGLVKSAELWPWSSASRPFAGSTS